MATAYELMRSPLPEQARVRVLVVDDHAIVRLGVRSLLERAGLSVVAQAATGAEAIAAAVLHQPDVVVLDLGLPDRDGVSVCRELRARFPDTIIVIFSALREDALVKRALEAGANAYLLKDAEDFDLVGAVRRALAGESVIDPRAAAALLRRLGTTDDRPSISDQERNVLRLAAEGASNREIGARLYLSPHTVKEYLRNAMRKLDVDSRIEAVLAANRLGLLD
jgi:two-component system, NarL family, response regulator DevR